MSAEEGNSAGNEGGPILLTFQHDSCLEGNGMN